MSGAEVILYGIVLVIIFAIFLFFLSMIFKVDIKDLMPMIVVEAKEAIILDNRIFNDRVIYEGFNFYIPLIEVPKEKLTLKEHPIDPPAQEVVTQDEITIEIDMIISVRITKPMKAYMEIEDYKRAVNSLLISSTNKKLGLMDFKSIQKEQDKIAKDIKDDMQNDCARWGVEVILVKFESISQPKSIRKANEEKIIAEEQKRATILKAEGEHKALELHADSEKLLIEKKAEATIKAIRELKELMPNLSDEKIMNFLTSTAYIDSVKQLSTSDNSKFVLYPSDVNQPLDKVVTSEYLGKNDK